MGKKKQKQAKAKNITTSKNLVFIEKDLQKNEELGNSESFLNDEEPENTTSHFSSKKKKKKNDYFLETITAEQIKTLEEKGEYSVEKNTNQLSAAIFIISQLLWICCYICSYILIRLNVNEKIIIHIAYPVIFLSVICFLAGAIIYKCIYKYSFDLTRNKLLKKYDFYFFHLEKEIADFSEIKLLAVSTINNRKYNLTDSYLDEIEAEIIVVYGKTNKVEVLKRDYFFSTSSADGELRALARILGCRFIPCDGKNRIHIENGNEDESIESLISFIPIDIKAMNIHRKESKYTFDSPDTNLFLSLTVIFGSPLLFLTFEALGLVGRKRTRLPYIAPWYVWITLSVLFVASFLLYKGYSYTYIFDLKRKKLLKEYKFYSYYRTKVITDFSEIKLIGVSTMMINQGSNITDTIVVYGKNNKTLILESKPFYSSLDSANGDLKDLTRIIGCRFIPCDGTNQILIKKGNEYDNIDSLITLLPNSYEGIIKGIKKLISL